MEYLSPSETLTVRNRIVAATRLGRVQDWNERIGEIADAGNVDISEICWTQSPNKVAQAVVDSANQRLEIALLERAIDAYEKGHPNST